MAEIPIDLSGRTGLASDHGTDQDMIEPQPHTKIANELGQMVSGWFNPYLRDGYMAPPTDTRLTRDLGVTPNSEFIASEFDIVSGNVYLADNYRNIYRANSLDVSSLSSSVTLEGSGGGIDELYDLQMYELDGQRALYYVGKGLSYRGIDNLEIGSQVSASKRAVVGLSVAPSSTTKPSVIGQARNFISAGANETTSYNLTGGTDTALFVVIMYDSSDEVIGARWVDSSNSTLDNMDRILTGNTGSLKYEVYSLASPTPTTGGGVRTYVNVGASPIDYLVYIIETDNTDQTTPGDAAVNAETTSLSTNLLSDFRILDKNQLSLAAVYSSASSDSTIFPTYLEDLIFSDTNTYGNDLLAELKELPIYGLQVGVFDTDLTSTGLGGDETWMASAAQGAFTHDLPNNYAFMRRADNGFAYVFAGNQVHKIDGTTLGGETGIATKNVLKFPDYFQVVDAVDYRSRMYMAIHQHPSNVNITDLKTYVTKCGIYIWNRVSTQLNSSEYFEIPGVKEIKKIYASPDGMLKLLTINQAGITELRQFGYNDSGGVVFRVISNLSVGAYPQVPDGCTVASDKTVWLANNGTIYSEKGSNVVKLHKIKDTGTSTEGQAENIKAGAILYGDPQSSAGTGYRDYKESFYISYKDGASSPVGEKIFPFDLTDSSNNPQSAGQGDVYTGVNYIPIGSIVRRIRVYNLPTTLTGSNVLARVKIFFNQSTTASMPTGMTKEITRDEAVRGYVDFNINKPNIHAVQFKIEWVDNALYPGSDLYLPSVAVISTENTNSKTSDDG